jgi:hypothetical protein
MVVIPQSELESLKNELREIKSLVMQSKEEAFMKRWVESEDARKQFGVCGRTWQAMRDKRVIPFTQFGRKIYFRQSDIEAFMEKNIVR